MRVLLGVLCAVILGACGGSESSDGGDDDAGAHDGGQEDGGDSDGGGGEADCFDRDDDDGDGQVDCSDSDCGAAARCVPVSDALGLEAGVTVGEAEACPDGFAGGEVLLHRDLLPGDCVGCGCTAGSTTCSATAWYYQTAARCTDDADLSAGVRVALTIDFYECSPEPVVDGFTYGFRVEMDTEQTCAPDGTAEASSSWSESLKFCRASDVGSGCAADEVCVRRTDEETQCALATGEVECSGYPSAGALWYTAFDDSRVCGACECTATGGRCDDVEVSLGSDWVCTDTFRVSDGEKVCEGTYSPPAELVGAPVDPDGCVASAPVSGEIQPTGNSTLCCDP